MALKGWFVKRVELHQIKDFIEKWHYSESINGCIADYCYALYSPDEITDTLFPTHPMKGAMFFGRLAMANQWKRFSDNQNDVIELRRLCCIDDTPRNAESYFIGRALKLLRRDWMPGCVVSYADKEYGHEGTIYKASNFKMIGEIPGAKVIMYKGKKYHDKTIRTKYNGNLKPFAFEIKKALDNGGAHYKKTSGKYTYVYQL